MFFQYYTCLKLGLETENNITELLVQDLERRRVFSPIFMIMKHLPWSCVGLKRRQNFEKQIIKYSV